jgi:hypothetical protein
MNKQQEKKLLEAISELSSEMDSPTIKIVDGNINEAIIRYATSYIRNLKAKKVEETLIRIPEKPESWFPPNTLAS